MKYQLIITIALLITPLVFAKSQISEDSQSSTTLIEKHYNLLTLNTWGLPVWYGESTSPARYAKLVSSLIDADIDILCLQETFHPKIRKKLKSLLSEGYKTLTDLDCNRKYSGLVTFDCTGGLTTFSKYPIVGEKFYQFPINESFSVIEKSAKKGFLLTTIAYKEDTIAVVNTHLYSGNYEKSDSQRYLQIKYINDIIDQEGWSDRYPVILAGDLNTTHPDVYNFNNKVKKSKVYNSLIKGVWEDTSPMICEDEIQTYDHTCNKWASKKDDRQKLDYILIQHSQKDKISFTNPSVIFSNENCISDHNGFAVKFEVQPNIAGANLIAVR